MAASPIALRRHRQAFEWVNLLPARALDPKASIIPEV
jgi:hypothetical protein